ncbi:MAG: hypothetical protein ACI8UO_000857 [Verrucomicrobiales bacterium]|jgi:hypothetical protein
MKTLFTLLTTLALAASAVGDPAELAQQLLERSEMNRGLCAVIGGDPALPLELAKASELLVHFRDPDLAKVTALRAAANEAGLDIQRLAAEGANFKFGKVSAFETSFGDAQGFEPLSLVTRIFAEPRRSIF